MKALLVIGGVMLAFGISLGVPALSSYADARAAWRRVSEDVELGGYDAALSDSLYQASEAIRLDAEWAGLGVALGGLFLLAGWTPHRGGITPPRPWRVTLIDGVFAWSVFVLASWGESVGAWDTRESSMAAAVSGAAGALFFLPYAPIVAGRSLGLTLTRGGLPSSLRVRLRAFLLAPISFPLLLLTFAVPKRFSWLKAIHLPQEDRATAGDSI